MQAGRKAVRQAGRQAGSRQAGRQGMLQASMQACMAGSYSAEAGRQQAGRQAWPASKHGRQAGRQASRQAGAGTRQAGRQACTCCRQASGHVQVLHRLGGVRGVVEVCRASQLVLRDPLACVVGLLLRVQDRTRPPLAGAQLWVYDERPKPAVLVGPILAGEERWLHFGVLGCPEPPPHLVLQHVHLGGFKLLPLA